MNGFAQRKVRRLMGHRSVIHRAMMRLLTFILTLGRDEREVYGFGLMVGGRIAIKPSKSTVLMKLYEIGVTGRGTVAHRRGARALGFGGFGRWCPRAKNRVNKA